MSYFTEDQVKLLLARIHPDRVFRRDGNSYVAGCDIRAELTRIFGFGRWSSKVLDQALLSEKEVKTKKGADAWYVLYRSRIRLTIHAPDGTLVTFHDGSHVGASTHPDLGEAHGNALTNSETYALRRAAINLGDQFGLSLYNGGSLDPLVRWTLVKPEATAAEDAKIDTDNVPKVSAEDSDSSSVDSDEEYITWPRDVDEPELADDARTAIAARRPQPVTDREGRTWLDAALEDTHTLKDEKAAGELWQEAVDKAHAGEITGEDKQRIRELVGARVDDLRKAAMEQALMMLSEGDDWRDKIRDLDGDEAARQAIAEVRRTVSAKVRAGRIIHAISVRWPKAAEQEEAAA